MSTTIQTGNIEPRGLDARTDAGMQPNRPPAKGARSVGDVMGNYDPHGDTAI